MRDESSLGNSDGSGAVERMPQAGNQTYDLCGEIAISYLPRNSALIAIVYTRRLAKETQDEALTKIQ